MRRGVVLTIVLFGLGAGSAQAGWMVNGSPLKTSKQVVGWGQIVLKVNETAYVAPYKETHAYTMSPMGEMVCRTVSASTISESRQIPELWAAYNCESTVGACSLEDTEGQRELDQRDGADTRAVGRIQLRIHGRSLFVGRYRRPAEPSRRHFGRQSPEPDRRLHRIVFRPVACPVGADVQG